MPAWLRVLVALPEESNLSASTQMAAHNYHSFWSLLTFIDVVHIDLHVGKTPYT